MLKSIKIFYILIDNKLNVVCQAWICIETIENTWRWLGSERVAMSRSIFVFGNIWKSEEKKICL